MQYVSKVTQFLKDNPWAVVMFWWAITGTINKLFSKKTPEQWVEFAEKNPKFAVVLQLLRAFGFDPVKSATALKAWAESKRKKELGEP